MNDRRRKSAEEIMGFAGYNIVSLARFLCSHKKVNKHEIQK